MSARRDGPDPWRAGTWEGNREAQLDAALEATPAQRLAWLEESLAFAFRAGARREPDERKMPIESGEPDNRTDQ